MDVLGPPHTVVAAVERSFAMGAHSRAAHGALKILVPTDFSSCCDAAADYAYDLALRSGGDIDLLYVWNPHAPSTRRRRRLLRTALPRCLSADRDGAVRIRGRIEFGELCSTISRVAESEDFDLIVVGLDEPQDSQQPRTESLARRLARHTTRPVITIRMSMPQPSVAAVRSALELVFAKDVQS